MMAEFVLMSGIKVDPPLKLIHLKLLNYCLEGGIDVITFLLPDFFVNESRGNIIFLISPLCKCKNDGREFCCENPLKCLESDNLWNSVNGNGS